MNCFYLGVKTIAKGTYRCFKYSFTMYPTNINHFTKDLSNKLVLASLWQIFPAKTLCQLAIHERDKGEKNINI